MPEDRDRLEYADGHEEDQADDREPPDLLGEPDDRCRNQREACDPGEDMGGVVFRNT
ncbi:hypothetical protein [Microlunatus endophyticus]|uniref:hypothetical protein n=1 Tax=Microlunatus endophyticus TaxID=1716077 RepID=UPI00166969A0|nr:hypothetical protein [Microlunatus endophyticus]